MRTWLSWAMAGVLAAGALLFAGTVVAIRSGLQRYSDEAVRRFPGSRVEALARVVDCDSCPIEERNHAVWALGQMAEPTALPVLNKHFDDRPCAHAARLCQYELRKAIRNIGASRYRTGAAWRLLAPLHQPWH